MDFRYVIKDNDNTIKIVEDNIIFYNFDKIYLHDFDNSIEDLYYDILYDNEIAKNGIYGRNDFNKKYIKIGLFLLLFFVIYFSVYNPITSGIKLKPYTPTRI